MPQQHGQLWMLCSRTRSGPTLGGAAASAPGAFLVPHTRAGQSRPESPPPRAVHARMHGCRWPLAATAPMATCSRCLCCTRASRRPTPTWCRPWHGTRSTRASLSQAPMTTRSRFGTPTRKSTHAVFGRGHAHACAGWVCTGLAGLHASPCQIRAWMGLNQDEDSGGTLGVHARKGACCHWQGQHPCMLAACPRVCPCPCLRGAADRKCWRTSSCPPRRRTWRCRAWPPHTAWWRCRAWSRRCGCATPPAAPSRTRWQATGEAGHRPQALPCPALPQAVRVGVAVKLEQLELVSRARGAKGIWACLVCMHPVVMPRWLGMQGCAAPAR